MLIVGHSAEAAARIPPYSGWWAPNHACVEAMLRASGFKVYQRIAHECYQCEPMQGDPEIMQMVEEQLLAATGQSPRGDKSPSQAERINILDFIPAKAGIQCGSRRDTVAGAAATPVRQTRRTLSAKGAKDAK